MNKDNLFLAFMIILLSLLQYGDYKLRDKINNKKHGSLKNDYRDETKDEDEEYEDE